MSITTLAEDYTWYTGSLHSDLLTDRSLAGKSSKIFARCARRQIFFQIFENPDLTQALADAQAQASDAYASDDSDNDSLGIDDPDLLDIPPPMTYEAWSVDEMECGAE